MGMTKQYLLTVITKCSDEKFGQDAVEWAIMTGRINLTGDLQTDLVAIMGEPGDLPETYDQICDAYRQSIRDHEEALTDSYQSSGLLEEILRPQSLAQAA